MKTQKDKVRRASVLVTTGSLGTVLPGEAGEPRTTSPDLFWGSCSL